MSSIENKFVWTDAYALGYAQMDDTHHEFVTTVNAMLMANDDEFAKALDIFADHAQRHFDQEAEWMNTTSFPAAGCHIDEHNAVMKSVRDVQALIKNGHQSGDLSGDMSGVKIGRGLAEELVRWFPGHADYLDSALSHWMSKRAFGGKPVVVRRNLAYAEPAGETSSQSSPK